jgi:pilus assembly protein CpaE
MGISLPTKRLSGRWKHLIICPDRTLFHGLTAVLGELTPGSTFTDLKVYPPRRALTDSVNAEQPNLCFLDVGSSWDAAVTVINELSSITPPIPIVAISAGNDPDIILRSLRQGASEFLFQPFAIEQVGVALDRLMRQKLDNGVQSRELGKVYCVMPAKGACGASTLACNLAAQLQKVNSKKRVLLADLDPSTGTLSFLLKLKSSYSFVDALSHASQMDEDLWKALVSPALGMDILLCPENPVETIPVHEAPAMIEYSRENYGAVVLDVASPYGNWVEQIAKLCDDLILVTTNELPALHATQRAIAHLERSGIERSKIRLVVNRYDANQGLDRNAIQTALNLEIFQVLPNDVDAIQKSLLEGKPLGAGSSLGKSYALLADNLAGGRKAEGKRQSILSGIFSVFDGVLHKG